MLFSKSTYVQRRSDLRKRLGGGLYLVFGHNDAPANYPNNAYAFRQDSSFLYFFAQERNGLVGVIDVDNDKEYLIGDDIDMEDIIWTGYVPSVKELAEEAGIADSAPMSFLKTLVDDARKSGRAVNYLPPCRHDLMIQIGDLLGIHPLKVRENASVPFIKAVVALRSVKSPEEVQEIEKAMAIGYQMVGSNVMRLFCLDPGYDLPALAFWNTIIDIELDSSIKGTYVDYNHQEKLVCSVDEILIIR